MDLYPQRVYLHLPSGRDKFQTLPGLILSLLLFCVLIAYLGFAVLSVEVYNPQKLTDLLAEVTNELNL